MAEQERKARHGLGPGASTARQLGFDLMYKITDLVQYLSVLSQMCRKDPGDL